MVESLYRCTRTRPASASAQRCSRGGATGRASKPFNSWKRASDKSLRVRFRPAWPPEVWTKAFFLTHTNSLGGVVEVGRLSRWITTTSFRGLLTRGGGF